MKLWLDDIRDPCANGRIGYTWVKTAQEAVEALKTGQVTFASLDHDLTVRATLGDWKNEITGYHVVEWMYRNDI